MNIAIDVRPLQGSIRTGVGEYAYELLSAVFSLFPEHQYYLCSSGLEKFTLPPAWQKSNIHSLHLKIPNKILNSAILFGNWPRLSAWPKLTGQKILFDWIYYPNLNFITPESQVKTIITIHDLTFSLFPEFFSLHRRLWHKAVKPKKLIGSVTYISTPSNSTANDLKNIFKVPIEKIKVIYPGQCSDWTEPQAKDFKVIKQKYNLPDKFILCLATIEPRKNILGLINAFAAWQKSNPSETELIIAGAPGWKNTEIFTAIKNTPKVHYIGYVSEKEKPVLYKLARIFVYPSFYEGFGLPVLDALRAGTPVIVSQRSALPEVTGSAAYLVDPNHVSDVVTGLQLLSINESLRNHYIQLGLVQAQKFSWEKSAHAFMEILSK